MTDAEHVLGDLLRQILATGKNPLELQWFVEREIRGIQEEEPIQHTLNRVRQQTDMRLNMPGIAYRAVLGPGQARQLDLAFNQEVYYHNTTQLMPPDIALSDTPDNPRAFPAGTRRWNGIWLQTCRSATVSYMEAWRINERGPWGLLMVTQLPSDTRAIV